MADKKEVYEFQNPDLSGARLNDVVAKVAKVNLKDTTRVMRALNLLAEFTGDDADYMVSSEVSSDKPNGHQSHKCLEAFDLIETVMGPNAIARVRSTETGEN